MARIQTETIIIEISKIYKTSDEGDHLILSDEQLSAMNEIVESTLAELLGDAVVIEVTRHS